MKVIIAGGRDITDYDLVDQSVEESGFEITEVVSGHCRGADVLGEEWAARYGVLVKLFPAEWTKYGLKAGPIRNGEMAAYADALVALDSGGLGTADMIRQMKATGKPVYIKAVTL